MYYRCIIRGYYGIDGRGRFRYNTVRSLRAGVGQLSSPQPSGMSGLVGQSLIDYLGTHLRVTYVRSAAARVSDVVLTNSGPLDIPPGARTTLWSIYFSHAAYGKRKGLKRQDVKCRTGKR